MKEKGEILEQYKKFLDEGVISQEKFEKIVEWYNWDIEATDLLNKK